MAIVMPIMKDLCIAYVRDLSETSDRAMSKSANILKEHIKHGSPFASFINVKRWNSGHLGFFLLNMMFRPSIVRSNHKFVSENFQVSVGPLNDYLTKEQILEINDQLTLLGFCFNLDIFGKNYKGNTLNQEMDIILAEFAAFIHTNTVPDEVIEAAYIVSETISRLQTYNRYKADRYSYDRELYDLAQLTQTNPIDGHGFDRAIRDAVSLLFV